jgi:hypothetical protein
MTDTVDFLNRAACDYGGRIRCSVFLFIILIETFLDLSSLSWTDTRRDRPSEDAERLATEYSGVLEEIWCGGI